MGRRNKLLGGTVVIALFAGLLAACSDSQKEGVGEGSSPSASQTNGPSEPVAFEWLAYHSYQEPDPESPIVKMVEERFNASYHFWYIDNQKWNDQLNVKFASGELPDALYVKEDISKYVDNGILAPISEDLIHKLAPTYAGTIDKYDPNLWNSVKYDGKLYALPSLNINGDYPTAVIWRKDWLDNVGITKVPETIEEFENALRKFRDEDPDRNGKKDTYGLSNYALPMIYGAFGYPGNNTEYVIKNGKVEFAAIQPEMKQALALLNRWYKEQLLDPEFVTGENTGGYWADSHALYNGRIGLTGNGMFYQWRNKPFGGDDQGGAMYVNFKKAQPQGELVFGKPPVGPDGKSGSRQWGVRSTPVGITTKGAKDPLKVETFLKMLETSFTDYDYYLNVFYGIEGKHWNMVDGQVVPAGTGFTKDGVSALHIMENPEFNKKAIPKWYAFGDSVKTKGYAPAIVPTTPSLSKYRGTLDKLVAESYLKIILGEKPVDSFDDFVKTFRANGGDEIEREVNEAYRKMIGK